MKFTWDGNEMVEGDKPPRKTFKEIFNEFLIANKWGLLLWSIVIVIWWWHYGSSMLLENVIYPFIRV